MGKWLNVQDGRREMVHRRGINWNGRVGLLVLLALGFTILWRKYLSKSLLQLRLTVCIRLPRRKALALKMSLSLDHGRLAFMTRSSIYKVASIPRETVL